MLKYLREYRFHITLFLFLLIPVLAIDTSTRAPRDYRLFDRALVAVTSPLQSLVSLTLDGAASFLQNYVFLFETRRDNLTLLEENRKLRSQIATYKELEQENSRLRRIFDFQVKNKLETLVAQVVAKDVSADFRAIRINRGADAGIQPDMAVLTPEGIIGRVLRTTANSADIVTLLDPLSGIDVIAERSRARGVVEGLSEDTCALRYALRTDDIQPGDILVSSGLGGVFPKGIPVGIVSRVNRKSFGITQDVEVRPTADFSKLEEIMVVLSVGDKAAK